MSNIVTSKELMGELKCSWSHLRDLRKGNKHHPPKLKEGVHWFRIGTKSIRYDRQLVMDALVSK